MTDTGASERPPKRRPGLRAVVPVDPGEGVELPSWALHDPANPLGATGPDLRSPPGVRRWMFSSGTLGGPALERHLPTWGPPGWDALAQWLDGALPLAASLGARVLLRPHARHVLSDVQRCVRLLADRAGAPLGLALDAGALLEASMLAQAGDHLARAFETLGPLCECAVLASVMPPAPGREDDPLPPAPIHTGALDPALLCTLVDRFVPADVPIVLLPEALDRQLALLQGGGPGG